MNISDAWEWLRKYWRNVDRKNRKYSSFKWQHSVTSNENRMSTKETPTVSSLPKLRQHQLWCWCVFIGMRFKNCIYFSFARPRSHFAQNPNLIKKCAMLKMRTILCDVWRRLILVFFFSVRNVNGKIRMIFEEVWLVRFGSNDSEKSLLRAATWIHEAVFYSSIPCI